MKDKIKIGCKVFLLITFIFLYKYNEEICEYFFPCTDITNDWWILRLKIYALMFCIPLYTNTIKVESKRVELFEYVILGIMSTDAFMFVFFNIPNATYRDFIGTLAITLVGYYNVYVSRRSKTIK